MKIKKEKNQTFLMDKLMVLFEKIFRNKKQAEETEENELENMHNDIPPVVHNNQVRLYIIAVIVFFAGIISVTVMKPRNIIFGIGFPVVVVVLLLVFAKYQGWKARQGYLIVEGECVDSKDFSVFQFWKPSSECVLQTENLLIHLSCEKKNKKIKEGMHVRVYIPCNTSVIEREGIVTFAELLGYEIVPEEPEENKKEESADD